jgi:hypothetical protein
MRPAIERLQVRELAAQGRHPAEIARLTGIPRATVRDWIKPRHKPRHPAPRCPECGHPPHVFENLPAQALLPAARLHGQPLPEDHR